MTYLRELNDVMARVKAAHPSLRQHLVAMQYDGYSFKRIAEFGLYSVHADPAIYDEWEGWEDEKNNDGITTTNRELSHDDTNQDEDEDDDEEMEDYDMDGYGFIDYDDDASMYGGYSDSDSDYGGFVCSCCD